MQLKSNLLIRCNMCGNIDEINKNDIIIENVSAYERNMGAESQYEINEEICCSSCNNNIEFTIECWEYPIGALNFDKYGIKGGSFIVPPEVQVNLKEIYNLSIDEDIVYNEMYRIDAILYKINQDRDYIYTITPREFEEVVCEIFQKLGYEVILTKQTRDGGKDLIMKTTLGGGLKFLINVECKKFSKEHTVGVDVVRSVKGVHVEDNVNKSIIVTTSTFTNDAKKFADKNELITLMDINCLIELIKKINS